MRKDKRKILELIESRIQYPGISIKQPIKDKRLVSIFNKFIKWANSSEIKPNEMSAKYRYKPATDYQEMIEREKQAEIEYLQNLKK